MVDTQDTRSSRGLSRRDMIKGAAVAGAAAWTAPVIIDSLSSPAAAASCGNRWYMKLASNGTCFNAAPLCNNTSEYLTGNNSPDNSTCTSNGGYRWVCATNPTQKYRASYVDNGSYYTVTLAAGCTFQSSQTNYTVVGNYDFSSGGGHCNAVSTTNGANTVNVPKQWQDGSHSRDLDYTYFEFVCA